MNILLTRPLAQVGLLQSLVIKAGHQPLLFPTIQIEALANMPLKNDYEAIIFTSVNAVEQGLALIKQLYHQTCPIFAVGASTAKKLHYYGFEVAAFPTKTASSEALLAMDAVRHLRNQNILIFTGKGGRQTLKQGLAKHNTVEYIEVYQRVKCAITPNHQASLLQFLQDNQGIITITSVENLSNMLLLIKQINATELSSIKHYPLVVLSDRIKTYAQSIGFNQITKAPQTNDKGLLRAIQILDKLSK